MVLPSVTFSINQSVNTTSGYSPHEIIYGQRPHFPLTAQKPADMDSIPIEARTYVRKHAEKLNIIRTEMRNNVLKSQRNMLDRANETTHPLNVAPGDYVYLHTENTCVGQKLQNKYTGPFVIDKIISPHLVELRNPENRCMSQNPSTP